MNIFERGLCVLQCRVSFVILPDNYMIADHVQSTSMLSSSLHLSPPASHT
jgi:hypothetical protein